VVAKTDVVVDVIGRQEFSTLLQDHPAIAEQLKAVMAAHLGEDDSR
jgi:CRP-like cAMP-binding protein